MYLVLFSAPYNQIMSEMLYIAANEMPLNENGPGSTNCGDMSRGEFSTRREHIYDPPKQTHSSHLKSLRAISPFQSPQGDLNNTHVSKKLISKPLSRRKPGHRVDFDWGLDP